jgi:hypothetical protein
LILNYVNFLQRSSCMKKTVQIIMSLCLVFTFCFLSSAIAGGPCADVNCDDGDECTLDSCEVIDEIAVCINEPIPGCGDPCADVDCDDYDACTREYCDPATGKCVYEDIDCADGDLCTEDYCDPATGCVNTEINCDDGDKCTIDSCDPKTGACVNEDKICDDYDECTDDYCDPDTGSCVYEDNGLCVECPPAYPKTQGYWQRQCRALGLIGKSRGKLKLHEEWMADLSPEEKMEICGNLNAIANDMCSKATKQLQAVMLNRRTERIANCNCIMPEGTVGSAIEMIIEMIADGDCKDANELADGINTGEIIVDCSDKEPPKPPTGLEIE